MKILVVDNRDMNLFSPTAVNTALRDFLNQTGVYWVGSDILRHFQIMDIHPKSRVLETSFLPNVLRKLGLWFPLANSNYGYFSYLIYGLDYEPKKDIEYEEQYGVGKGPQFAMITDVHGTCIQQEYYTNQELFNWGTDKEVTDARLNFLLMNGRMPKLFTTLVGS